MLHKVMKKMHELEDAKNPSAKKETASEKHASYPTSQFGKGGYTVRQDGKSSHKGAERARSIGNRMRKSSTG